MINVVINEVQTEATTGVSNNRKGKERKEAFK